MEAQRLRLLLESVANGKTTPEQALAVLRDLPYQDLGFALLDSHRALRQGLPEVIFCPGKSADQIAQIADKLRRSHSLIVATRCTEKLFAEVAEQLPGTEYDAESRTMWWGEIPAAPRDSAKVAVITAGTADLPVAEEACFFLRCCGCTVNRLFDVGVAGLHRLLGNLDMLRDARAAIVVAGMDGALPSVVGGILACPIIAVPTSVGYGASFDGLAALLTMLNSCAAGVTVVNIDNGFGSAVAALRILSVNTQV